MKSVKRWVEGEHDYFSTACLHGKHSECRQICKFCQVMCRCDKCHHSNPIPIPNLTKREHICEYQDQVKRSRLEKQRALLILGVNLVLDDAPSYPDGDPRTAEEIVDAYLADGEGKQ